VLYHNFILIKDKNQKELLRQESCEVLNNFHISIENAIIDNQMKIEVSRAKGNAEYFIHKYSKRKVFPDLELNFLQRFFTDKDKICALFTVNKEIMETSEYKHAQALVGAFGIEVIAFDFICKSGYYNGFKKKKDDIIYINTRTIIRGTLQIPTIEEQRQYVETIALHELAHHFQDIDEDLYMELFDITKRFIAIPFPENISQKDYIANGYTAEEVKHEYMADYIAKYVTRRSFWEYVMNKNKGLSVRVKYWVKYYFDSKRDYFYCKDQQKRQELMEIRQLEKHILKLHKVANL